MVYHFGIIGGYPVLLLTAIPNRSQRIIWEMSDL